MATSALRPSPSNTKQEREAEFRDQSEATNARVVRWTLIQLGVLGVTCAWQLSHLRAFFIKQKLT
jgi:p24 family protein alpha